MRRSRASGRAVAQLDRHLRELTREHGQIVMVDTFRDHVRCMARHDSPPPPPRAQSGAEAASEADRLRQLRAAIATRLERGDTLETVERELIATAGLPGDQQSALWLYVWSHPKRQVASQPRLSAWTALANALLTLIGIYRC